MKYITYCDRVDKTESMRVATSDSIAETVKLFKPYIQSDEYIVQTICNDGSFIMWEDLKNILTREEKLTERNKIKFK